MSDNRRVASKPLPVSEDSVSYSEEIVLPENLSTLEIQQLIHQTNEENSSSPIPIRVRVIHAHTTCFEVFWNITKLFDGAGTFALPWALSTCGLIPGLFGFLITIICSLLAVRWTLISSHTNMEIRTPTIVDITEYAIHSIIVKYFHSQKYANISKKIARYSMFLLMFANLVPGISTYLSFMSESLHDWFPGISYEIALIFVFTPIFLSLSIVRSYKYLSRFSFLAIIAYLTTFSLAFYEAIFQVNYDTHHQSINGNHSIQYEKNIILYKEKNIGNIVIMIASTAFLISVAKQVLSQEQAMYDHTIEEVSKNFSQAFISSFTFVSISNGIFMIVAYFAFVAASVNDEEYPFPENILTNFEHQTLETIAQICLCFELLATFPLMLYPVTEALDTEFFDIERLNDWSIILKGNIYRVLIVILAVLLSLFIQSFAVLAVISGGLSLLVEFSIPAIIFIGLMPKEKSWKIETYFFVPFLFVFGIVICVTSIISLV